MTPIEWADVQELREQFASSVDLYFPGTPDEDREAFLNEQTETLAQLARFGALRVWRDETGALCWDDDPFHDLPLVEHPLGDLERMVEPDR